MKKKKSHTIGGIFKLFGQDAHSVLSVVMEAETLNTSENNTKQNHNYERGHSILAEKIITRKK